ncbi:hypothetical protein Tsubulata_033281 [Turnera subulata]|uniref:U3 small nucleolar RNA-associated protein 18 homolog n=1 Tax=Turnera subulata TaxID=218843 RepID=A0A9Q0J1N3_9ROSI|nr:hypothetical protein Tsubulata_033281 [Turnera subulata]
MSLLSKRNPQLAEGEGDEVGGALSDLVVSRTKKRRKDQLGAEEVKEMKKLEDFLFGSLQPVEFGKGGKDNYLAEPEKDVEENGAATFFLDNSAGTLEPLYFENAELSGRGENEEVTKQRKAVWFDEEEEKTQINISGVNRLRKLRKEEDETFISGSEYVARARTYHAKLNRGTDWAHRDSKSRGDGFLDDSSSDEENGEVVVHDHDDSDALGNILRSNEDLVVKSKEKLLPGLLEYSGLGEANREDMCKSTVTSVQFHRNGQLLLTAGLDRRLRFFQIDGKRSTKIESIFLDDCPIRKASFLPNGTQVIIAGRRKFFYCFDVMEAKVDRIGPLVGREEKSLEVFEVSPDSSTVAFVGNEGYILLVSTKTKELIGTLKMNGNARALAFADDGRYLLSHGGDGHVYHWDLRTRSCIHKAVDEGCINGTALCTSPNGKLFATGSDSGIVNVYNREKFIGGVKTPIKAIENLTTKVDFLKFNNDAQILAICSHTGKRSLKLIHVPSFTAFSNWPPVGRNPNNSSMPHYPWCLDFSPGGGFMAVGDATGKVLLYKLHHYHRA